ncbi:hypothetical protein L3V79_04075 [Thiotrichales bacterium 19S9-12]|nr:hypothetical protein [Thiotrichales bacterium 19S9-11]MCF6811535.1 hypothetical protein [Thiotrichales bacterium 19S9-12]
MLSKTESASLVGWLAATVTHLALLICCFAWPYLFDRHNEILHTQKYNSQIIQAVFITPSSMQNTQISKEKAVITNNLTKKSQKQPDIIKSPIQTHKKATDKKQPINRTTQKSQSKKVTNDDMLKVLSQINQILQQRLASINNRIFYHKKGLLIIDFTLKKLGNISDIKIEKSSGYINIDQIIKKLLMLIDLSKIKIPHNAESIRLRLPVNIEQGP